MPTCAVQMSRLFSNAVQNVILLMFAEVTCQIKKYTHPRDLTRLERENPSFRKRNVPKPWHWLDEPPIWQAKRFSLFLQKRTLSSHMLFQHEHNSQSCSGWRGGWLVVGGWWWLDKEGGLQPCDLQHLVAIWVEFSVSPCCMTAKKVDSNIEFQDQRPSRHTSHIRGSFESVRIW